MAARIEYDYIVVCMTSALTCNNCFVPKYKISRLTLI